MSVSDRLCVSIFVTPPEIILHVPQINYFTSITIIHSQRFSTVLPLTEDCRKKLPHKWNLLSTHYEFNKVQVIKVAKIRCPCSRISEVRLKWLFYQFSHQTEKGFPLRNIWDQHFHSPSGAPLTCYEHPRDHLEFSQSAKVLILGICGVSDSACLMAPYWY